MSIYIYIILGIAIAFVIYLVWQKIELNKFAVSFYKFDITNGIKNLEASCLKKRNKNNLFANNLCEKNKEENKEKQIARFVVLSDLHNHVYGEGNERLLDAIDKVKPDFVIVAGDMMIAKPGHDLTVSLDIIGKLAKKYDIYYGMGNHEYRLKLYPENYENQFEEFKAFLEKNKVRLLENESETIIINEETITITGLEIDKYYYKRLINIEMNADYINEIVGEKNDNFTILIAHNPEYFEAYANWGADLTLSGHIHGGMLRLPYLGGVISPKIRIFPKYDSGLFDKNGKKMLLSRGLGMHTIPVRINNRAELLVVDLVKKG